MKSYGPRFYDVEEGGGVRSSHETVFASRPPAMVHAAAVLGSPPRSSAATRINTASSDIRMSSNGIKTVAQKMQNINTLTAVSLSYMGLSFVSSFAFGQISARIAMDCCLTTCVVQLLHQFKLLKHFSAAIDVMDGMLIHLKLATTKITTKFHAYFSLQKYFGIFWCVWLLLQPAFWRASFPEVFYVVNSWKEHLSEAISFIQIIYGAIFATILSKTKVNKTPTKKYKRGKAERDAEESKFVDDVYGDIENNFYKQVVSENVQVKIILGPVKTYFPMEKSVADLNFLSGDQEIYSIGNSDAPDMVGKYVRVSLRTEAKVDSYGGETCASTCQPVEDDPPHGHPVIDSSYNAGAFSVHELDESYAWLDLDKPPGSQVLFCQTVNAIVDIFDPWLDEPSSSCGSRDGRNWHEHYSFATWVHKVVTDCCFSPTSFMGALMYLKKFSQKKKVTTALVKQHFCGACVLSEAFFEDNYIHPKHICAVAFPGTPQARFNQEQVEILKTLDFNLWISREEFFQTVRFVLDQPLPEWYEHIRNWPSVFIPRPLPPIGPLVLPMDCWGGYIFVQHRWLHMRFCKNGTWWSWYRPKTMIADDGTFTVLNQKINLGIKKMDPVFRLDLDHFREPRATIRKVPPVLIDQPPQTAQLWQSRNKKSHHNRNNSFNNNNNNKSISHHPNNRTHPYQQSVSNATQSRGYHPPHAHPSHNHNLVPPHYPMNASIYAQQYQQYCQAQAAQQYHHQRALAAYHDNEFMHSHNNSRAEHQNHLQISGHSHRSHQEADFARWPEIHNRQRSGHSDRSFPEYQLPPPGRQMSNASSDGYHY
eukprot:gene600-1019_t